MTKLLKEKQAKESSVFLGNPPLCESLSGRFGLFKDIFMIYLSKRYTNI